MKDKVEECRCRECNSRELLYFKEYYAKEAELHQYLIVVCKECGRDYTLE